MVAGDPASVLVFGDAGLDVLARHFGPIAAGDDTRAKITITVGGAGANTAAWLAHCGASPTLVARVGDDLAGAQVRRELTAAGVRCVFTIDPRAPTCCVVVLVDDRGQRGMLPDRGANARLSPSDVPGPEELANVSHLHLSGYVLLDDSSREAGIAALAAARAAGLTTSVDPQAAALLTDPAAFLEAVRGVDLLLPNAAELAVLAGSPEITHARKLLDTVAAVVVTTGEDGAHWVGRDEVISVPAPPAPCLDSTGAGDAFNAGFLSARLTGLSTRDSLVAGVRCGAEAVTTIGAQPPARARFPVPGRWDS